MLNYWIMSSHIFVAMLIDRKMHGAKGAPSNLLLYDILVDPMDRSTIVLTISVLGAGIDGFLDLARSGWFATMMSQRAFVCRR